MVKKSNIKHRESFKPFAPAGLQAAAIRFKNSFQENAKSHAITEDIIEACHNGIASWIIIHFIITPVSKNQCFFARLCRRYPHFFR